MNADLSEVLFINADLREAHLSNTDLSNAYLSEANLSGANLWGGKSKPGNGRINYYWKC